MTEVTITQADRDALERIDDALGFLMDDEREIVLHAFARHRTLTPAQAAGPVLMEMVAVVGNNWSLLWASQETLTDIVKRTGIKIGSPLYASAPASNDSVLLNALKAVEAEGLRNHATRCAPWWKQVREAITQAEGPQA